MPLAQRLHVLQQPDIAAPLKEASLTARLKDWTRLLTSAVEQSCRALGWRVAAKGFPLDLLPQAGQEYLGMDVMAFDVDEGKPKINWVFPVAVFELENSRADERIAYSLWKILCLRCPLRVVFAYRKDWQEARELINELSAEIVPGIPMEERSAFPGKTLIVLGSRGEGETFPWGYFRIWELDQGEIVKFSPAWLRRPAFLRENLHLGRRLCACGRCCLCADAA